MHDRRGALIGAFLWGLLLPSFAWAQSMPAVIALGDSAKGKILTDSRGMTLYSFDQDKSGASSCYGKCVDLWPLFKAADGAAPVGSFSLVTRDDGIRQWAYQGHPLYYSDKDKAPGDVLGDGVRDSWHIVKP
jgi:predicted lipoprotein with Yx(FWY)xxD motif